MADRHRLRGGAITAADRATRARLAVIDAALVRTPAAVGRVVVPRLTARRRHRWERRWARSLLRALRVEVVAHGLDQVETGRSYVVVPLHESVLDPVVLLSVLGPLRFVVRDEIAGWPDVGGYVRASRQVIVSPERGRSAYRRILAAAPDVFAAGESLVLFPQGTILGIETAFARGAFELAARLSRPVLPVVLTGARRIWEYPLRTDLRLGQRVAVEILPAIEPADLAAASTEEIRRRLQAAMKERALGGELPEPARFEPEVDGYWDGFRYEIDDAFPEVAAAVARHRGLLAAVGRDQPSRGASPKIDRGPPRPAA